MPSTLKISHSESFTKFDFISQIFQNLVIHNFFWRKDFGEGRCKNCQNVLWFSYFECVCLDMDNIYYEAEEDNAEEDLDEDLYE